MLGSLQDGAFDFVKFFHGAPYADFSKVGVSGSLPPIYNMNQLLPLRTRRERTLPPALRRRGFTMEAIASYPVIKDAGGAARDLLVLRHVNYMKTTLVPARCHG